MKRRRQKTTKNYSIWLFLLFLFFSFMLVRVLISLGKATLCWKRERKEVKRIEKENEKLEKQIEEIWKFVDDLRQGKGWEEKLRERGFVKKGEILIQIEGKLPEPSEKKEFLLQKLLQWLKRREEQE